MEDAFDPYHKWLGIPPAKQPPTCYRLLGVPEFEDDPEVIEAAADRQMAFVRTLQTGARAELSQMILNELARARAVLLDPRQKTDYDIVLRSAAPAEATREEDPPVAESVAEETPKKIPSRFGNYKIVEKIRFSGTSLVFKSVHTTGRLASLKVLHPKVLRSLEAVRRFAREVEITLKLDHPNLIMGYEAGEQHGLPFLVTEYVMGMDLATLVNQRGPLPVDQAIDYVSQAARGLIQLHLQRVFHRNLKPHVLMVDMAGNLKVTNLFLARVDESSSFATGAEKLTIEGQSLGSFHYLPPEQADNARDADARSDMYALGCTLCFLLTGQPPYASKSSIEVLMGHANQPIPSLQQRREEIPESLERVFKKMLSKDPAGRYQFMGDLIDELEACAKKPLLGRMFGKVSRLFPKP